MPRSFVDRVLEALADQGPVHQRPMFGGAGLFSGNLMFAIAANDLLYFRADAHSRVEFERRGLERFCYEQQGQRFSLDYYRAPAEVFRDSTQMTYWMRLALDAAARAQSERAA
jgi:DNA transformation protein and related proteins